MLYERTVARNARSKFVYGVLIVSLIAAWRMGYTINHIAQASDGFFSRCLYPLIKLQQPMVKVLQEIRARRFTMHELRIRVANLEQENEQLLAEIIQLYAHRDDTVIAQELAEFRQRYEYADALSARVMLKMISEQEHAVLVDAGSQAGVQTGMVAVHNNSIVGKVTHVYPWYSKVMLVTDRMCKVASYCVRTGVRGIHEGNSDGVTTQLTHVHHYDQLEEGDLVLSSGEGVIFPHGFALGRVQSFKQDSLWTHATVKPALVIDTLDHCLLFKKGQRALVPAAESVSM